MIGLGVTTIGEDRRVHHQQSPGEGDDFARAATIFAELVFGDDAEIVDESEEDFRIGSSPRVNRLLVVADGKDVSVSLSERMNDHVLHGIQILKLIDEDGGVPASHFFSDFLDPHQLGRLENEHVEVEKIPLRQEVAVSLIENAIVVLELVTSKAMS